DEPSAYSFGLQTRMLGMACGRSPELACLESPEQDKMPEVVDRPGGWNLSSASPTTYAVKAAIEENAEVRERRELVGAGRALEAGRRPAPRKRLVLQRRRGKM